MSATLAYQEKHIMFKKIAAPSALISAIVALAAFTAAGGAELANGLPTI